MKRGPSLPNVSVRPATKDTNTIRVVLLIEYQERFNAEIEDQVKRLHDANIAVAYTAPNLRDTTQCIVIGSHQQALDKYKKSGHVTIFVAPEIEPVDSIRTRTLAKTQKIKETIDLVFGENGGVVSSLHKTQGETLPGFKFLAPVKSAEERSGSSSTSLNSNSRIRRSSSLQAGSAFGLSADLPGVQEETGQPVTENTGVLFYQGELTQGRGGYSLIRGNVNSYLASWLGNIKSYDPSSAERLVETLNNINQFYVRHFHSDHSYKGKGLLRLNKDGVWSKEQRVQLGELKAVVVALVKKAKDKPDDWRAKIYQSVVFQHKGEFNVAGLVRVNRSRYEFFCRRNSNRYFSKETATANEVAKLIGR